MEWNYFTLETWNISNVISWQVRGKKISSSYKLKLCHISDHVFNKTKAFILVDSQNSDTDGCLWIYKTIVQSSYRIINLSTIIYLIQNQLVIFFFILPICSWKDHLSIPEQWLDVLHNIFLESFLSEVPM